VKNGIRGEIEFEVRCSKCLKYVAARDKFCRSCGSELQRFTIGDYTHEELRISPRDVMTLLDEVSMLKEQLAKYQPVNDATQYQSMGGVSGMACPST
jgi:predicted amidophosphoribosyltransferase